MTPFRQAGDARGRRYSPEVRALARRLYAAGEGWSVEDIVRILNQQDVPVRAETVRCWVDDEYRRRRAKVTTETRRRRNDAAGRFVRKRMVELHHAGLNPHAISVIVELYHGRRISEAMVRHFLEAEQSKAAAAG